MTLLRPREGSATDARSNPDHRHLRQPRRCCWSIVELVRRRRLKEEYSLLWILTALTLLVLSIWYGLLLKITDAIGAVLPSSTLFFFGTVFLLLMVLHFSVRVSRAGAANDRGDPGARAARARAARAGGRGARRVRGESAEPGEPPHAVSGAAAAVSYVLVAYNSADAFRESLPALARELRAGDEVIVVDNASADDSKAVVARALSRGARSSTAAATRGSRPGRTPARRRRPASCSSS